MALENVPEPVKTPEVFVVQVTSGAATLVVVNTVYPPPGVPPLPVRIRFPPEVNGGLKLGLDTELMVNWPVAGLKVAEPAGRRVTAVKLFTPALAELNNWYTAPTVSGVALLLLTT